MCRSVLEHHADALRLGSHQGSLGGGVLDALAAAGNVLGGNVRPHDPVLKLEVGSDLFHFLVGHGFDETNDFGVLSLSAGLFLVGEVEFLALVDGLTVVDLGGADRALDFIFAAQAFDVDFEMELAHATDDGFVGDFVEFDAEGGVLFGEFGQGFAEIVLVFGASVRLYGKTHDRLRHEHAAHEQIACIRSVAKSVHALTIDAEDRHHVSGTRLVDLLHIGRMHPHDPL
mmetsp:Transcript_16778/g.37722  ORF Transcript_16778/g.37722 Transcript_16778/m.37722 type:complete len:229 (-) Transcript_16778:1360-2046(-)